MIQWQNEMVIPLAVRRFQASLQAIPELQSPHVQARITTWLEAQDEPPGLAMARLVQAIGLVLDLFRAATSLTEGELLDAARIALATWGAKHSR